MEPAPEPDQEAATHADERTSTRTGYQTAPGERERILAAAGWESDSRRRPILRELLQEEIERIYLYSYAGSRHRATAIDRARRTLMSTARTLEVVPDGCPLTTWCFFLLEEERANPAVEPDLWRALLDLTRRQAEGKAVPHGASGRMGELAERYSDYLSNPSDPELTLRADGAGARRDLGCFLQAQFGDEPCESRVRGPGWRQAIPAGFWRSSRLIATVVVVVALALAVFLWQTWKGLGERNGMDPTRQSVAGSGAPAAGGWSGAVDPARGAVSSEATLPVVPETVARQEDGGLSFGWKAFPRADRYRVLILTAKLDTLRIAAGLEGSSWRVDPRAIDGLRVPGSYLFQVDGFSGGSRIASSGLIPLELK